MRSTCWSASWSGSPSAAEAPRRRVVDGSGRRRQPDVQAGRAGVQVPPAELTVVGDADQSIYAFRGATIRNIVEFETDYPDARTILLEQNYRSTQTILSAANPVIERNPDRKPKKLWTDAGDGAQIIGYVADNEHDEASFIAEEIDRLRDEHGVGPGDVAVFYRTNAQSPGAGGGVRPGRPAVPGGRRHPLLRAPRGQGRAGLPAGAGQPGRHGQPAPHPQRPARGIGDRAEACVAALADRERISFAAALRPAGGRSRASPPAASRRRGVHRLLEALRTVVEGGAGRAGLLEAVLEQTGYLAELRGSHDPQDESRVENLAELVAVAQEYDQGGPTGDRRRWRTSSNRSRWWPTPTRCPIPRSADEGVVTLMTLHTAKGLEFPVVFLTGLEDGIFPHLRSLGDPDELAEERRLAYVGITRARQRLYLSRAAVRSAWGQPQYNPARGSSTRSPPSWSTGSASRGESTRSVAARLDPRGGPVGGPAGRALAGQPSGHPPGGR